MSQLRSTSTRRAGWKARLVTTIAAIAALAGPAAAQDLVSNLGEMGLVGSHADYKLSVNDFVMPFTTGTNASGYRLESISIEFVTSGSRTHDPVYVSLLPDNGSGRHATSGQIATLTRNGINYLGPVAGVNKYSVWRAQCYPQPPHGGGCISRASSAHLDPNTTYWVYIWAGEQATTAELKISLSQNESGAAGWTIGNAVLGSPVGAAHSNYTTLGLPVKMKVEGTTNPEVLISVSDVTVTEGVELTADFVVSLSRATSGTVTVEYLTIDGTALAFRDYQNRDGTLTFQPGETSKIVSVPIIDDAVNDSGETFQLLLVSSTGADIAGMNVLGGGIGTGTIINAEPLALSISDATATEGVDATIDFTLSLNRATNRRFTVNVFFSSGTADFSDVTLIDGSTSVTFEPGETEKTYSFGIVDDGVNEPSESFQAVLQYSGGSDDINIGSAGNGTITNTETLTASFENVPQDHDGSTAFTFNVSFTNDVSIGPAAMRDHAFTVTNGDVTGASRVNGRSDRWLITVDPDGDDAVTITLPGNRACATQGAICSDEDNPVQLSNSPSATVAAPPEGDPLTASFSNVPDDHDGGDFFVDLTFSEGPDVGYRVVQKAVKVSGGSINRANRKTKGSNVGWKLKVRPSGTGSLTITLPATTNCSSSGAICTEDGRRLSNSPSATVAGPAAAVIETTPTVSIAGGSGTEGDDGSIAFTVTLDEAASGTVTVDYATSDGSAEAGDGYTAASGTLSFAAGETSKAISVAIDDDIDNESDETFTVRLSNASGADLGTKTATGTIRNRTVALLTARFGNMPAEHDGSEFTFDLHFSENVNAGYARVRDDAFDVDEGEIVAARRKTQGSNQSWTIRVKPEGTGQISITLPATTNCSSSEAICTHDKRKLSHSTSDTVLGPVGISIDDAEVEEGANAVLAFAVALSHAASSQLTIDYATSDGTATAGADYTATSGTLTIDAGSSSGRIEVPVLDDSHDEGEETMTLRLSNPSEGRLADAEATGTIENTDPLPRALLARFGRATALHVMEQVEERLEASRASGFRGRFAGRELRRGMERDMGRNFLSRLESTAGAGARDTMGGQSDLSPTELLRTGLGGGDLLMGSGFVLNRETGGGASVSLWSRGMESRFSGRDGELSLDGGVRTTMFGADYAKGPLMAGLMLSHRRGLGGYQGADIGQVASSVTGLHPWVGYQLTERVTLWGVTGYGRGSLSLTPGEALSSPMSSLAAPVALEGGLSMSMLAGGVRGDLVDSGAGGFGLAFKADALWVGTGSEAVDGSAGRLAGTEAVVTRVRTALEASRGYVFGHGITLRPSFEVGLRRDGGDAETGVGADVAASLIASDPLTGLSVDVRVRTLLVHQDEGFRERGVSVSFSYDPTPQTPLGFTARVAPSWGGQAMSGADALWGRDTMEGLGAGGPGSGDRIDAELGYALPVGSRLVGTPRFGVTTSEYGRDYRLGYSLAVVQGGAMSFQFGLDAQRRESLLQEKPDHSLVGRLTVGW